jgi:hypothetical protein
VFSGSNGRQTINKNLTKTGKYRSLKAIIEKLRCNNEENYWIFSLDYIIRNRGIIFTAINYCMKPPTPAQQNTCAYTGTFGALIATTCVIQHLAITRDHWVTLLMLLFYLFSIVSFILLALQKRDAPILLIISAVLSFAAEIILLKSYVFSLIVLLLFLYTAIVLVVLYMDKIPSRLRDKAMLASAEKAAWEGKI